MNFLMQSASLCNVVITSNLYPYTTKFVFVGVRIYKDQQMRCLKIDKICA